MEEDDYFRKECPRTPLAPVMMTAVSVEHDCASSAQFDAQTLVLNLKLSDDKVFNRRSPDLPLSDSLTTGMKQLTLDNFSKNKATM